MLEHNLKNSVERQKILDGRKLLRVDNDRDLVLPLEGANSFWLGLPRLGWMLDRMLLQGESRVYRRRILLLICGLTFYRDRKVEREVVNDARKEEGRDVVNGEGEVYLRELLRDD